MTSRHVLVLGGHGKIAQYLTPLLLQRSWTVTSVIRSQDQVATVEKLGQGQSGKLHVLVHSLEDIKDDTQAKSLLDKVKPDYLVWSAGAGGKGGAERTFAIDRDAAISFIHAAVSQPTITKFLLVSYIGSRRAKPAWWSDESWADAQHVNKNVLASYHEAKVPADEELYKVAKQRSDFIGIDLRPGTLTADPSGKVELGKTKLSRGKISRESVAQVAALLLEAEGLKSGWLDLLEGDEDAITAVKRIVQDEINTAEGESFFRP